MDTNIAPLLLRDREVCCLLDISRALFWQMVADGRFGPLAVKMGRCKRWRRNDVERWVAAGLPERAVFVAAIVSEGAGP